MSNLQNLTRVINKESDFFFLLPNRQKCQEYLEWGAPSGSKQVGVNEVDHVGAFFLNSRSELKRG